MKPFVRRQVMKLVGLICFLIIIGGTLFFIFSSSARGGFLQGGGPLAIIIYIAVFVALLVGSRVLLFQVGRLIGMSGEEWTQQFGFKNTFLRSITDFKNYRAGNTWYQKLGRTISTTNCTTCGGSGQSNGRVCPRCGGRGHLDALGM